MTRFSLDIYYHADKPKHDRSHKALQQRINEIGTPQWRENQWMFAKRQREQNDVNSYCYNSWNLLNEAANCYIMGLYNASVMASSMSVEMLLNGIIILKKRTLRRHRNYSGIFEFKAQKVQQNWYRAKSIYGPMYYVYSSFRFLPIIRLKGGYYSVNLPAMYKKIQIVNFLGYDVSRLSDIIDQSGRAFIFVARRDKSVHADFPTWNIAEQLYSHTNNTTYNLGASFFHRPEALDQYKRAHDFVRDVFRRFDSLYKV
jgi:hypothetical protein